LKKFALLLMISCVGFTSHAQLMVTKLVGKDSDRFGLGYGLFCFFDIPSSMENRGFRVELMDLGMYPLKGEKFFTTTADFKAYISVKIGYKYVFSETKTGFYLVPSAGYARVVDIKEGQDPTHGNGIAAALEGGYSLEVGEKGHAINLGVKYEYDYGNATHILQSVGLRLAFAFNISKQ
jgi:hypothetical protein